MTGEVERKGLGYIIKYARIQGSLPTIYKSDDLVGTDLCNNILILVVSTLIVVTSSFRY